jgi:hypothetical protein
MGLHSGSAVERDDDYFGPAVNRAARVEAAAHGGQILLTQATEQLLRGELAEDEALLDLGERQLKGLVGRERLFQVLARGLESEFPPLRTLDTQLTNLIVETDELYGRDKEQEQIAELLADRRTGIFFQDQESFRQNLGTEVSGLVLDEGSKLDLEQAIELGLRA